MRPKLWPGTGLIFGSGLCALLYQTTWLREFRLIFGNTTAATAAVIGIFMGGLGIGSALLGKRAEASKHPLQFYAQLELMIAGSAAVTPVLLSIVRAIYVACGGTLVMGAFLGTVVRLLLAAIVLGTPTVLMGGTLPAMARFAVDEKDTSRRGFALLYGLNTLGAVAGAGLGTFVLLEQFGNRATLCLACVLNAIVAGAAWLIARHEDLRPLKEKVVTEQFVEPAAPARLVFFASAITGFVFLLMELVWYRMLSPLLGGTAFTFGLILAIALFGIGLGGVLYSLGQGTRRPTLNAFALTCAIEALCMAFPFALGDRLAITAMLLQPLGTLGFYGQVLGWTALCSVIVLPAAVVAGIQFPILLGLLGKGRDKVGTQTGTAYAWNTAGAIAGSLAGGFGLIPIFSATGTWKLVVALLVLCAFLAAIVAQLEIKRPLRAVPCVLAGALATALIFFSIGPTAVWRDSGMGLGLVRNFQATPNQIHDLKNEIRRDILWEADGREVGIGISHNDSLAFVVNGKCDGNSKGDSATQIMSGLLGALVHPHPSSAAVVGLGTGSTAGWLAAVPSIGRVDVMEIEPTIVKFAAECAAVNQDALNNPKLHVVVGDGRESLLTTRRKYDLIVSEPSNPYRAGVASLFTREYYQAVAKNLNPRGVFAQWMQAYRVDTRTIQIFYATMSSVFPHIETWQTGYGDLLLLASEEPITYDIPSLRARIATEPFQSALTKVWRSTNLEGMFSHYIGNDKFPQIVMRQRDVPLNTDDRTLLEFAFARTLQSNNVLQFENLRRDAGAFDADHPSIIGELDWKQVREQRMGMFVYPDYEYHPGEFVLKEQPALAAAFSSYAHNDFEEAWDQWKQLNREPRTLPEYGLVSESLAEQGDARAFLYIDKLREVEPAEAQAIETRLLWQQGRRAEATASLVKTLKAFRTDPWPTSPIMTRTLKLAEQMAQKSDKENAESIYNALQEPFAVYNSEDLRKQTFLHVALAIDHNRPGVHTLAGVESPEPNVPWQLEFLKLRKACYERSHHPLAAVAARDLVNYLKNDNDSVDTKDSPVVSAINRLASSETR
ncbi:MAG TPA: fused MFS/spermidine synthase [Chthoniobacterales bacterium]|nr:fused MFS/spermidine synthase [Chthoniobacterales bacterium]